MNDDELVSSLVTYLLREWSEYLTPIEIGSDERKVSILRNSAKKFDPDKVGLPGDIRVLYREVFLRDIWDKNKEVAPQRTG